MSIDANKLRELIEADNRDIDLEAFGRLKKYLYANAPAIADLADEVERLRKVLDEIANTHGYSDDTFDHHRNIARRALAKPAKGGGE